MNTRTGPVSLHCSLGLLSAMALFFHASSAAAAGEPELQHVRVCDSSACYRAWNVVDSDNDGFADADELAAGTDPFDAASSPPLEVILDLIGLELLPTFELGVGELMVMPTDIQEMREMVEKDPFAAFPLGGRMDALTRAGIDSDLLTGHGIDAEFGGFTFTLGDASSADGPPRRVGGMDIRLLSGEAEDQKEAEEQDTEPGYPLPEQGETVPKPTVEPDGSKTYDLPDGNKVNIKPDGGTTRVDKDGKPVKTSIYVNPDSDMGGTPSGDALEAWERIRNAAVRTMAGWTRDFGSPEVVLEKNATIILLDPDYIDMTGQISGPPRVTTAQPETRPDLFNPLVPGGGCAPHC